MNKKLAVAQGDASPALLNMGMHDVLRDAAIRYPDRVAVTSIWQNASLSFHELDEEAEIAASALWASGVRPGDRVGIWSANRWEWVVVQFAAARIGAILVNINPVYRSTELGYVLKHSGCKALFLASCFRDFDFTETAARVKEEVPSLQHMVVFGNVERPGFVSWKNFLVRSCTESRQAIASVEVKLDEAANIQYTSGTTGAPKGATLSHLNLVNNAFLIGNRLGLVSSDKICLPVPMFHCFGMCVGVLSAFCFGATVVFPGESFEAGACLDAIESERCTAFYGVPMMFIAMLNHERFDSGKVQSLRTGLMGGAPCPVEILRAAIEKMHMQGVSVVYGMTETAPISFQSMQGDSIEQRVETVGAVQSHVEAKVVDPTTGETVAIGESGELCVRGYLVMLGYWENQEATQKAIDADGWMHTGDLARMREDGRTEIVGRIKDMVIRGGENIFPREVEEFLYTIDGVEDAQVFGAPDQLYGEKLCVWIRLKAGSTLTADSIRAQCKGRIASFKIPSVIRIVGEYPTTASGKVQKFRMREMEVERERNEVTAETA